MKTSQSYVLYKTVDSGIMFPRLNQCVMTLAEGMSTTFPLLGVIPIGGNIKTIFVPTTFNGVELNYDDVQKSLGSKKFNIFQNLKSIQQSFIIDSTPYFKNLIENKRQSNLIFKLMGSLVGIIDQECVFDIHNWAMVYILDDSILKSRNVKSFYFWPILEYLKANDGNKGELPFDDIFIGFSKDGSVSFEKIYEKDSPIDFKEIRKIFFNYSNNFTEEDIPSDTPKVSSSEIVSRIGNVVDRLKNITLPNLIHPSSDKTKSNLSIDETPESIPTFNQNYAETNINNFPFLVSKEPNEFNQVTTDKNLSTLSKVIAMVKFKGQPKDIIFSAANKIKDIFVKQPDNAKEAIDLLKDKDYQKLSIFMNSLVEKFDSNIYPVKPEVSTEVLQTLDKWSEDRGYEKPVSVDPIYTASIIDKEVHSNLHRAMAQKEITWQEMPSQIEEIVTPVLADAGFKFLAIAMEDMPPDPKQVEPTYMTHIKIKIQNTKNKKIQTIKFLVPTLIDGKYHISGGIKWLFPNILATLPIFVVEPGKVQFKTNYSAMTFLHNITSKKDVVSVMVGGVKMPLLVWFLQLRSFNDICKAYGVESRIVNNKKELDPSALVIKLPDRQFLEYKIVASDSSQAKIAKALYYDMQPLINKVGLFDFNNADDEAKLITALTGRRTANYAFGKIKRYMIDLRIANILKQRQILPELFNVSQLCAKFSINNVEEDKMGISNVYLRLMDLIPAEVERALHYALTEYRRRSVVEPDSLLMVNEGWIINALREQSVLILYKDGNPTIETAQFTAVRLVGPGGFSKTDTVQVKDRRIPPSHFGVIDPIDTAEGAPGIQTYLTSGFEYDPDSKTFKEPAKTNDYRNMFSSSASMIPFISHDDGNRAQFGCSQTRQVVPILGAEAPLVQTGMEAYIPSYASTKFIRKAKQDGQVIYVDSKVIVLRYNDGTLDRIDIRSEPLQTGSGKASALVNESLVKVGDKVSKFQQLIRNSFINGTYSSGLNVLGAFKTVDGYSYEDGVVVSESFAKKTVSSHYDSIDIMVDSISELKIFPTQKLKETGNMKYAEGDPIVKVATAALGGFQENTIIAPTACEVFDIQVYPAKPEFIPFVKEIDTLLNGKTNQALRQNGLNTITNVNSIIDNVGKFKFRKDELTQTLIRIKVIEYRAAGLGDKLNNRHGNKGVITKIIPDDMMPQVPDGRHLDICFSPLGVVSRMNLGQLYEMHTGNVLDKARRNLESMSDNEAREMLCKLYTILDGDKTHEMSRLIVENLKSMGQQQLHQTIEELKKKGIRVVFPAYQSPSFAQIQEAAKLVGTELKSKLYLPDYKRYTINTCTWGMIFVNKLEHISSIKQNTRSVGKSIITTMMPGKPGNHRNAIRIGEMDTWCLLAYDAKTVVKELFEVNGDNPRAKLKVIGDIESNGEASIEGINDLGDGGSNLAFKIYSTVAGLDI